MSTETDISPELGAAVTDAVARRRDLGSDGVQRVLRTSLRVLWLAALILAITASPTPTPTVPSTTIGSSYFGDHILGPLETNINGSGVATAWPSWSPTTVRLWNTYGYNSAKGVYEGISWTNINTAAGVYDWTLFDAGTS